MKSLTKNTFVAEVNISLPCEGKVELNRWLNLQHTGKELISLTEKVSREHKEAAYALHRCRRYRMKFRINKRGDWKLMKVL